MIIRRMVLLFNTPGYYDGYILKSYSSSGIYIDMLKDSQSTLWPRIVLNKTSFKNYDTRNHVKREAHIIK